MSRKKDDIVNESLQICSYTTETTKISIAPNSSIISQPIKESKPPLHSHQPFTGDSLSSYTFFRLLNSNVTHAAQAEKSDQAILKKLSPAFGTSQVRNVKQFQGAESMIKSKEIPLNQAKVTGVGYEKEEDYRNILLDLSQNQGSEDKLKKSREKDKMGKATIELDQGVKRLGTEPKRRGGPGPGYYDIQSSLINSKGVKISPHFGSSECRSSPKSQKLSQLQIKSEFEEKVERIKNNENLRNKYREKKQKNDSLFWLLTAGLKKKPSCIEEEEQEQEGVTEKKTEKVQKTHKNTGSSGQMNSIKNFQLYRHKIRQKTLDFLQKPQYQPIDQLEQRKPKRQAVSNSFRIKNDHAYQAHYYKRPDDESDYIFLRGRPTEKIQREGSCFKSNLKRIVF